MDDIKKEFEEVKKSVAKMELHEDKEKPVIEKNKPNHHDLCTPDIKSDFVPEKRTLKLEDKKEINHDEEIDYKKEFPEIKLTILWIIGSIFIFVGSWFAGHLRENIGLSTFSYATIVIISFLFILLGGFRWIMIAVIVCHEE
ncbi:MAG: hypothetical protein KAQ92_05365 [Candidatus Aenigmarchaeota archaeon]|nr:hypothetical protein [Candidatus Aenigmarchaeota archaeon]